MGITVEYNDVTRWKVVMGGRESNINVSIGSVSYVEERRE